jgi:hypothetical protein
MTMRKPIKRTMRPRMPNSETLQASAERLEQRQEPAPERLSREQESRASERVHERYDDVWEPGGLLTTEQFPARPGFVQRWVRTHIHGVDDPSNVMRKMNERWRPRMADTVPADCNVPTIDYRGKSVIGIHGTILMERRIEDHNAHQKHHRELVKAQMRSQKENLFSIHRPGEAFGAPHYEENTSRVERGRGAIMDD